MITSTLTFFANAYDNQATDECAVEFTWDELVEFLGANLITSKEKNGMGFVWATYDTAHPAEVVLNRATGKLVARRDLRNIIEYHGLALDYDGGASIVATRALLEALNLKHIGYSSFNHKVKAGREKFRVLIPFSSPCPVADYYARRHSFLECFPEVDESTFQRSRIFFAPNVAPENAHHYEFWHRDGVTLDWREFEPEAPYVPPPPKVEHVYDGSRDALILEKLHGLAATGAFANYKDWLKLGGALYAADFSVSDFQSLSNGDAYHECEKLFSRWRRDPPPLNGGYLINLIRKVEPDFLKKQTPATRLANLVKKREALELKLRNLSAND